MLLRELNFSASLSIRDTHRARASGQLAGATATHLEQRERYYSESRLFAALSGITDQHLPENWMAFSAYIEAMVLSDTLTVTEQARLIGRRLLAGADTLLPVPDAYRALTS